MGAAERFAGALVEHDVALAPLTTLRVGPIARRVITATTTDHVVAVLGALDARGERTLILAGGSNVVIAGERIEHTVVRLANASITVDGATVRAEAGARWDDVVVAAIDAGLGGLECLSGIPGSAGATPVQNVGAYGVEVAQTITRVRLLDRGTGDVSWVAPSALGFGYRRSALKDSAAAVVLEVEFGLDATGLSAPLRYRELAGALDADDGARVEPRLVREAVLALRRLKGMVLDSSDHDTWSVGSFFTNPVVPTAEFEMLAALGTGPVPHWPAPGGVKVAAAWLVEQAGFGRGYPGPAAAARVSTKHTLALTNRGAATAADIVGLAAQVRDGVRGAFGITLVAEPVLVGTRL